MAQSNLPTNRPWHSAGRRAWLVILAYLQLLSIDFELAFRGFAAAHGKVRKSKVRRFSTARGRCPPGADELCHAVDLACVFYFKKVLCLERSAATAILLRDAGHSAELVIGVRLCPFRAHAWVEIAGLVVNDKPYTSSLYQVMERC
jgi:hypothetical protein